MKLDDLIEAAASLATELFALRGEKDIMKWVIYFCGFLWYYIQSNPELLRKLLLP